MNYRGAPIQLVQQNTESAVPFFTSSKGWGLLWDCSSETWLNALEPRVTFDINRTSLRGRVSFVAAVSGVHHVTASTGALAWEGAYVPLRVSLVQPGNVSLFEWTADTKNAPPYRTGRATLKAGVYYTLEYDLTGFAAPDDRPSYRETANLFVTPPTESFSLQSETEDFVDYYVFAGATIDESVALYRTATGPAPLYPRWAFGFFQSKNHYKTQDELVAATQGFRERSLPLDVIVQDWHYWGDDSNWGPAWDPANYPDPSAMTQSLHDMGCHLMVSVWSRFGNESEYLLDLVEKDQLIVQVAVNSSDPPPVAAGEHWMDIFQPGTAQTFFEFVNTTMFAAGVDALWLDATEPPGWPQVNGHVRVEDGGALVSGKRYLSSYSIGVTTAVDDGIRKHYPDRRTFSLTRASWAGQQCTGAALWTGDTMGTWAFLRRQVAASINFGLSGMPFWSQDIGGFHRPGMYDQYTDPDYQRLFVRWFQFGAFTPIFRVHGSGAPQGTEYWLYGDEVTANCNATARFRSRLLPYIYSVAATIQENGSTLQRGLPMDFPDDSRILDIADQYTFGPALLVAPVLDPGDVRVVYLPHGRSFFDFYTGVAYQGGVMVSVESPPPALPLFGMGGSLLVLGPEMEWSGQQAPDPLEVRVYPGADAQFSLFEDDGETRAEADVDGVFRAGNTTIPLFYSESAGTITLGARRGAVFDGMLRERSFLVVIVREGAGVGPGAANSDDVTLVHYHGVEVTVPLKSRPAAVV